jgi:hypothetical protein
MQKLHNICDLSEEYIQKVKLALSSHVGISKFERIIKVAILPCFVSFGPVVSRNNTEM